MLKNKSLSEEEEALIGDSNDETPGRSSVPLNLKFQAVGVALLACSIVFYGFMRWKIPSYKACELRNWAWSPLMQGFEFEWRTFSADNIPIEYMGPPTDERREAWEGMSEHGWISFPRSQLPLLNKSIDGHMWVGLPPPQQNQLIAMPEVVHQSHCVALIYDFIHRTEWDYSKLRAPYNEEFAFKLHANHCFFLIMNLITCNADITPVLFERDSPRQLAQWKTRDAPHLCKNWDVLGHWQAEHKVCRTNCLPEDLVSDKSL